MELKEARQKKELKEHLLLNYLPGYFKIMENQRENKTGNR